MKKYYSNNPHFKIISATTNQDTINTQVEHWLK
jgi:hypothetical protein